MRNVRKIAIAAMTLIALITLGPQSAFANNFGSTATPTSGCSAWTNPCGGISLSTTNHWWMPVDLSPDILASIRWTAANNYNPTDMSWTEVNTVSASNNVYYYDNDWGDNGTFGWATCPPYATTYFSHPFLICMGSEVHFNLSPVLTAYWHNTDGSVDWSDLGFITGHESGHSVGLRHFSVAEDLMCPGFIGCARTPWISSHDVAHINANY